MFVALLANILERSPVDHRQIKMLLLEPTTRHIREVAAEMRERREANRRKIALYRTPIVGHRIGEPRRRLNDVRAVERRLNAARAVCGGGGERRLRVELTIAQRRHAVGGEEGGAVAFCELANAHKRVAEGASVVERLK